MRINSIDYNSLASISTICRCIEQISKYKNYYNLAARYKNDRKR